MDSGLTQPTPCSIWTHRASLTSSTSHWQLWSLIPSCNSTSSTSSCCHHQPSITSAKLPWEGSAALPQLLAENRWEKQHVYNLPSEVLCRFILVCDSTSPKKAISAASSFTHPHLSKIITYRRALTKCMWLSQVRKRQLKAQVICPWEPRGPRGANRGEVVGRQLKTQSEKAKSSTASKGTSYLHDRGVFSSCLAWS